MFEELNVLYNLISVFVYHMFDYHLSFILSFPAPVFYFGSTEYHVDESDAFVEVQVWRTGSDLSKGGTVTVRSRKTDPLSAEGTCLHFHTAVSMRCSH